MLLNLYTVAKDRKLNIKVLYIGKATEQKFVEVELKLFESVYGHLAMTLFKGQM